MIPLEEHRRRLGVALDDSRHPLDRLVAVRQLRHHLDRVERDAARAALARGDGFAVIARALEISRQAARQRYGDLPVTEPVTAEDEWWRRRRELEAQAERYFAAVRRPVAEP
jgi:hypothetical protein